MTATLKPNSTHFVGCSSDEDPDGETMCVCDSIEAEPEPDDHQCQAEFIDGSWYGDDCPECRNAVTFESADCERCAQDDYCSKHENGVYG